MPGSLGASSKFKVSGSKFKGASSQGLCRLCHSERSLRSEESVNASKEQFMLTYADPSCRQDGRWQWLMAMALNLKP